MIPQPPEFFALFSTDRRGREAVATAERLRAPGMFRAGAAFALRGLADRLSPLPAPPRAAGSPVAVSKPRPVSSRCQHAA
jgi:hypothetical protein